MFQINKVMKKILVIGSSGQIGNELVTELRKKHGEENVVAGDIRKPEDVTGLFENINVLDQENLLAVIKKHNITEVYQLAAMLSATAEQKPALGWDLNMTGLFNLLNLAKDKHIEKLYWPSSIAVFGPTTPRTETPQLTIAEPTTVYGISKLAGERWCEYYHQKYGVDVRSIRYPGLISYKTLPGGGTTDYAVDIFHKALAEGTYDCFLSEGTTLPMMYMEDAIKATIQIMDAPAESVKIRSSYNVAAFSFNPKDITTEIQKHLPEFNISYTPDFRQAIADSWPQSIDDTEARNDWNWSHKYDLAEMTTDMLTNLKTTTTQL